MDSYSERLAALGERARTLRIACELQQAELAARSGLSIGTVVRFERTGNASLENVLRIARVLGAESGFERLFESVKYRTLDEALAETPEPPPRQRVRRPKRK